MKSAGLTLHVTTDGPHDFVDFRSDDGPCGSIVIPRGEGIALKRLVDGHGELVAAAEALRRQQMRPDVMKEAVRVREAIEATEPEQPTAQIIDLGAALRRSVEAKR